SRLLPAVVDAGATLVCGTTGFSKEQVASLKEASNKIPVLYSPNMSVGVNLLFLAVREMTKWAGEDFDIEVFEMHHKMKRDAPSGTALRIAEHIADVQEQRLADVMKTDRYSQDAPREAGEIGMQSARGGDIVGEHTVFYCGMGERIELTHRATSRDIFARGALRAASWMAQKPAGFYSMFDVLSFAS
ncbi:MAG TPA: 4-hydroxy-tetrahydrodipicolinate reductase, partial [Myxococcales bacterium]|nr:4-hydroxy-tetrahydrodipicolinate reductase [Myxococcales bacterium]